MNTPLPNKPTTDKPPFLNSWRIIYLLQIGILVLVIFIFYIITKIYNK